MCTCAYPQGGEAGGAAGGAAASGRPLRALEREARAADGSQGEGGFAGKSSHPDQTNSRPQLIAAAKERL